MKLYYVVNDNWTHYKVNLSREVSPPTLYNKICHIRRHILNKSQNIIEEIMEEHKDKTVLIFKIS